MARMRRSSTTGSGLRVGETARLSGRPLASPQTTNSRGKLSAAQQNRLQLVRERLAKLPPAQAEAR
jgi:hypothetical protein